MNDNFLPISRKDMEKRGWSELDIIIISGDAYVDHHSFGAAAIGRFLEHKGFKVGIIAQPDWRSERDFVALGKPKLFFGITSGNVDSMVANYTANKRPRQSDDFSPGGKTGLRPDRAVIVYANRVRQAFKDTPIVIGGIEASTRRLGHYDYWDNALRRSLLLDSRADILVYGMGEGQTFEIAQRLARGEAKEHLDGIRGTVVVRNDISGLKGVVPLPSFEEIAKSTEAFNRAFVAVHGQMNPFDATIVAQQQGNRFVVQNPPVFPFSVKELDEIYGLPYARDWHPSYARSGGIKGFETVKFSITSHRGCCGECSFCALYYHHGRIVQSRSEQSILREASALARRSDFKGTITDIGGPTANLYAAGCSLWKEKGFCRQKHCLLPQKCANLRLGYEQSLQLYRKIKEITGVKHVFIGSGFRYDLLTDAYATEYLKEVCRNNISGLMKVAPEHCSDNVLALMNKPPFAAYEKFVRLFQKTAGGLKKNIFIVNYFIAAHPGASLQETLKLALYLAKRRISPQQIQDFIPVPMTLSSCLYYTETNPFTGKKVYVAKTFQERKMQRALLQYNKPSNRALLVKALKRLDALRLLGKFTRAQKQYRSKVI